MTILLILTLFFLLLVDLLPPHAAVEPDIRRRPLQDIQQHSDHTDPSRRYMLHTCTVHVCVLIRRPKQEGVS